MIDFTLILFWLIAFAALYFLGPISIYFIGILALLSCLCCSTLSSLSSSSVRIIKAGESSDGNVRVVSYDPDGITDANMDNIKIVGTNVKQCGGVAYLGEPDGFDMTPDEVYAAFRDHPYDGENLGYGYYDGYDYVL